MPASVISCIRNNSLFALGALVLMLLRHSRNLNSE